MFGDENTVREVEEALARHACQPAGLGFNSFFDLDQLAQHVQTLKMNIHVSGLPQQCKSLFAMESPARVEGNDGRSEMETDDHGHDAYSEQECCSHGDDEEAGLLNIPVQAFLHILQYLDAKDICSLSSTCRQCDSFCSDQHLWKSVLIKDMVKWSEVSHGTFPSNLTTHREEVDYKDIYMKCNPELQRDPTFNLASIPRLLWSFLPRRTPIIVMFGPGLETDTSSIVRKFITGHGSDIIKVNGVFPAMFPGVGTGFEVTVNNKSRLRLVVLYSATRKEREARDSNQPRMSKLIKRTSPPNQDSNSAKGAARDGREDHGNEAAANHVIAEDDYLNFEPNDHVKSMCQVVGGFIFVVDAAQQLNQGSCSSGRPELFAFMDSRWTPDRKPLLVLSSVANPDVPRIPCVRVADQLSLEKLQRPWKVVDCDVSSLSGLSEGVDWLVGSAPKIGKTMELLLRVLVMTSLLLARTTSEDGKLQRVDEQNFVQFAVMVTCATSLPGFLFNDYGCHCGLGGKGTPVDDVDRCCQIHDECYDSIKADVCRNNFIYLTSYKYTCKYRWPWSSASSSITCDASKNDACRQSLCECDRNGALCFARSKYNIGNTFYDKNGKC